MVAEILWVTSVSFYISLLIPSGKFPFVLCLPGRSKNDDFVSQTIMKVVCIHLSGGSVPEASAQLPKSCFLLPLLSPDTRVYMETFSSSKRSSADDGSKASVHSRGHFARFMNKFLFWVPAFTSCTEEAQRRSAVELGIKRNIFRFCVPLIYWLLHKRLVWGFTWEPRHMLPFYLLYVLWL